MGLLLRAVEVEDRYRWRWVLSDPVSGTPLADHPVVLDPGASETRAFEDLYRHLRWRADPDRRVESEAELLTHLGAWLGQHALGEAVGRRIADAAPVTVRIQAPEFLWYRPLELAHVDGVPLARRGVSLVYKIGTPGGGKAPVGERLRMVALFSLPTETTALALRRERYELSRMVRRLAARRGRAVDLQVLQYGVTRDRLAEAMTTGGGPDVLHISGHGSTGELLLELSDGSADPVSADDLLGLLVPAKGRVKLAVVSACESAAGKVAETLGLLGLAEQAAQAQQQADAQAQPASEWGIGHRLAAELDCAVVAMRYPVADEFAIRLADRLYEGLFHLELPLDRALPPAVAAAAGDAPSLACPAISIAVPALFGARAAGLSLTPPRGGGLRESRMAFFPDEPERFVGRARVMAEASTALAPNSGRTAVLLYGMAGAGKTACALELAYRHEQVFADGLVFWQAPTRDDEFGTALTGLASAMERQVDGFTMVDKIGTPDSFRAFLPRLSRLLADSGLLLVLDNLETLLTDQGTWRDPRWADLLTALTGHHGESRVVLTSRIRPAELGERVLVEPVHALSRDESVLLARELPHLRALLHTEPSPMRISEAEVATDRNTVTEILRLVQGHPKLLELADAAAADPDTLAAHLTAARAAAHTHGAALSSFFTQGESRLDAAGFLDALTAWTTSTLATLPEDARLLFQMLCQIAEGDRNSEVVEGTWTALWRRLHLSGEPPEPTRLMHSLIAAALVHAQGKEPTRYDIHPGVAEAVRENAPDELRAAIDMEVASWWITVASRATATGGSEDSDLAARAGLCAADYLIRLEEWGAASAMLEVTLQRDESPAATQAALPHLRRIAKASGTLSAAGGLAIALARVNPTEAEQLFRETLDRAVAAQDYKVASTVGTHLANLLRDTGRLRDALTVVDRMAEHTTRAGFGPWTQLSSRGQRLQIMNILGEHEQVLTEVESLRDKMDGLPDQAGPNEIVNPWHIREAALDVGAYAAKQLGRWQQALDLNAQVLASQRRRRAGNHALAKTQFNDYGPLMRLGHLDRAETLLRGCQQVFEDQQDLHNLARVLGARANVAANQGRLSDAIAQMRAVLRLTYVQPDPYGVAVAHHNYANYLRRDGQDPVGRLAHQVAAALIYLLVGARHEFFDAVLELARDQRTLGKVVHLPGSVADVAAQVEQDDGVRFTSLVEGLAPDPETTEAALTEIVQITIDLPNEDLAATRIDGARRTGGP